VSLRKRCYAGGAKEKSGGQVEFERLRLREAEIEARLRNGKAASLACLDPCRWRGTYGVMTESKSPNEALQHLAPRDREVLELVAEGLSNREIGERQHLAPETIKKYRQRIIRKLGARNMTHAVGLAYQQGLLGGPEPLDPRRTRPYEGDITRRETRDGEHDP
jgi:DNA-binding CsgD family transcriptional regulator